MFKFLRMVLSNAQQYETIRLLQLIGCLLATTACSPTGIIQHRAPNLRVSQNQGFKAQKQSPQFSSNQGILIWNGFSHKWGYNHRLNRLGSYIHNTQCNSQPCHARLINTAASGTGKDTANFETYYSEIKSKNIGYQSGKTSLIMAGVEEETISRKKTISIPALPTVRNQKHYQVVLNGFDIYSTGGLKAKKLQAFSLGVEQIRYQPTTQTFEIDLQASLNVNCDSVECKIQSDRVLYEIEVTYAIIAGTSGFNSQEKTISNPYSWDTRSELTDSARTALNSFKATNSKQFPFATMAFKSFAMSLTKHGNYKDQWFVDWNTSLHPSPAARMGGKNDFTFKHTLMFKQWNRLTKKRFPLSFYAPGEAKFEAKVALLEFQQARISQKSQKGQLLWPGRDKPADTDAAKIVKSINY